MPSLILKGAGKPWYPNSVGRLEDHLVQLFKPSYEVDENRCRGITKNVACTLQYLEFLTHVDSDLALTAVLTTQTCKAFVINGSAVIEAFFYYILFSSRNAACTEWQFKRKVISPEFELDNMTYRQKVEFFVKLPKPVPEQMTFDAMCKRVESKKLIKLGDDFYSKLPYLRGLRNRVHIHSIGTDADTDYLKFESKDFELMKSILKSLLNCHLFSTKDPSLDLGFLDPRSSVAPSDSVF